MDISQLLPPDGASAQDVVSGNTPTADPSQMSPQDLEMSLFGAPIAQAAPELASVVDPTALSDSSQNTNTDYSFYTDPSGYLNQADYSPVDQAQPFYDATQPTDLSTLDPSYYDY